MGVYIGRQLETRFLIFLEREDFPGIGFLWGLTMLQKMGLGVFGGIQVSNNVKYYGMNKKLV